MNPVLLDTDTLSFFFRGHPRVTRSVTDYLGQFPKLSFSAVTYYEVLHGLYYNDAKSQLARFEAFASLHTVVPFTAEMARTAALLYADLRRQGQPIGHNDILIAATAISNKLQLITNNTAHFSRITGLDFANWMA